MSSLKLPINASVWMGGVNQAGAAVDVGAEEGGPVVVASGRPRPSPPCLKKSQSVSRPRHTFFQALLKLRQNYDRH